MTWDSWALGLGWQIYAAACSVCLRADGNIRSAPNTVSELLVARPLLRVALDRLSSTGGPDAGLALGKSFAIF